MGVGDVMKLSVIARSRRRRGEAWLSKGQSSFRPCRKRRGQEMDSVATLAMTSRKTVSSRRNYRAAGEARATARRPVRPKSRSADALRPAFEGRKQNRVDGPS